jgi:hypothetical protein
MPQTPQQLACARDQARKLKQVVPFALRHSPVLGAAQGRKYEISVAYGVRFSELNQLRISAYDT